MTPVAKRIGAFFAVALLLGAWALTIDGFFISPNFLRHADPERAAAVAETHQATWETRRTNLFAGAELPTAVILISDPESETVPETTALRKSFELTPAEADLASVLMTGKSLEEAAEQLLISMNTARTQLKAIFSKTETRRQGELIRLLLLSVAQVQGTTRRY